MGNRREFIQATVAAATAVAAASLTPTLPAVAGDAEALPVNGRARELYKVIYDSGFAPAVAFAAEARRVGATVQGIRGNITDLWYRDLYHRWASSPVAIGGMTRFHSMFGLQMMARDHSMRLVYQAVHRRLRNGTLEHSSYGPTAFLRGQPLLEGAGWATTAAGIVMNWRTDALSTDTPTNIAAAGERAIGPETLLSWIIAPVARV